MGVTVLASTKGGEMRDFDNPYGHDAFSQFDSSFDRKVQKGGCALVGLGCVAYAIYFLLICAVLGGAAYWLFSH